MSLRTIAVGCLLVLSCAGCSCQPELVGGDALVGRVAAGDAGRADHVEGTDTADLDAGEHDAGEHDAGEPDARGHDAGEPDAGEADAGEPDGGQPPGPCVPPDPVAGELVFTDCFCTASGFCPVLASHGVRHVGSVSLAGEVTWFTSAPFLFRWRDGDIERAVFPKDELIRSVGALGADDLWIGAQDAVLHWDGENLERFTTPPDEWIEVVAKAPDRCGFDPPSALPCSSTARP